MDLIVGWFVRDIQDFRSGETSITPPFLPVGSMIIYRNSRTMPARLRYVYVNGRQNQ